MDAIRKVSYCLADEDRFCGITEGSHCAKAGFFAQVHKGFGTRRTVSKSHTDESLAEMTGHSNPLKDDFGWLLSAGWTPFVEAQRPQQNWPVHGQRFSTLRDELPTHSRSRKEKGRCLNDVRYYLDGARKNCSSDESGNSRQELNGRIIRLAGQLLASVERIRGHLVAFPEELLV